MISIRKLYDATENGLRIIEMHYRGAREAALENKPFRMRDGERTPSAWLKLFPYDGGQVWKATDFGGDGHPISPLDIHCQMTGYKIGEAIANLAAKFNITDNLDRAINRPDVRKNPATSEQQDGTSSWDIDQEFTKAECVVMGPRVTSETLKSLNWYRVNSITQVKNREATTKYSNENYPIFMRECWFEDKDGNRDRFYKIYEPLNVDKQWRFQYQPKGKKPQKYVNGLDELIAAYKALNEKEEKMFFSDPANEGKPFKEVKLPEAIICSGERDSLCVKSLGYHPLWFNSETYVVSDEEWKTINRYVEKVYNIPDIDTTGIIKGTALALRFIDVHTIWLPEKLSQYRDNRGKPCKDFRDWMEIWKGKSDFRTLMELATPAKFWTKQWIPAKKGGKDSGRYKYDIDVSCLREFLKLNGFYLIEDKSSATLTKLIKIDGRVVTTVFQRQVRAFVHDWAIATGQSRELRNLILKTPLLSSLALTDSLSEIKLDFSSATEKSQMFYFPTHAVKVTAEGMERKDNKIADDGLYVWDDTIIQHNVKILPDMFEITHPEGCTESEDFDIDIKDIRSNCFRYLINSSRIYWRKELEVAMAGKPADEIEAYKGKHRYDIAGPNLTPEEIQEQKQCLINKIFTIGYIMHRYKSESRAWAPYVMDNVIGENDQCNGRSGKSFLFRMLSNFTPWCVISGRDQNLLNNQFLFQRVTEKTSFVLFDDLNEYIPMSAFYDKITSAINVNMKSVAEYTLPFSKAPKLAFTTNYVPKEFNSSTVGRMIFVVFSDYYHVVSDENDYRETRSIMTDLGKELFSENYPEADWEADCNFVMQCVKFYLSVFPLGIQIQPQMKNIIFRKFMRDMSDNFREWAEAYFSLDGGKLDTEIIREKAYEDFKNFSGMHKMTMQKFTKSLRGFCYTCDYIDCLNPEELHTSGTRILRRIEDPATGERVQKEMIYLRSKREAERLKNPPPPSPTQQEMPF